MIGRRTTGWAAALVAAAALAGAEEATVRAEVDATRIGVADLVQLTVTIEGPAAELAEELALPPLKNLRLAGGPSVSQEVSFVNGAMSQSRAYSYVLQPVGPGRAEIGALQVKLTSGVKTTTPIGIEVVPGSVKPRQARPPAPFGDPFGEDPFDAFFGRRRPRVEPKLKVVATASRPRLHVGEPVLVTFVLYTQASITDIRLAEAPQFAGFWAEDVEPSKTGPRGERTSFEGESYVRFPILRKLLFPAKAGTLTIPPVRFRLGLARVSLFSSGPSAVERTTEPLTVSVDALPAEPGFGGAVGEFDVDASLDRAAVALGEAATLRFTVRGRGNLKWVERAPELSLPGAKVYPPQTKSDLKVSPEGMTGSKTWEFVVVPETSGALTIPPLPFAYFAPSAGALKRTQTAALTLQVQGGAATAAAPVPGPAARTSSDPAGLALRSDLDLPGRGLPVLGARSVLATLGLLLVLHGVIGASALLADRRRAAAGRPAARRDVRAALCDLDRVRRGRLGKEEAAALIERTLHGVFGAVTENGGPPGGERERAIRDVLQQVQFIRYAPQLGDYSEAIRDVAARAAEVVRKWA